ncbi:MAG: SUMF1/EgtB/PvdO family nonheme iron enzyme [Chloroflexota bacterium]|nr:SUMF1/EgtB/PvdO family nonheme iron enzyme [Chloroflexota bacterium]
MSTLTTSTILDDHPTTKDLLDFAPYREILVDILRDADTSTPLTIGLFGSWGSGKTSLMRMLQDKINEPNNTSYFTVWFNAWKYNHEDALWRALILRVLDELRTKAYQQQAENDNKISNLDADLDRLEESLYRTVEWEELGRWTLDWAKALRNTTEEAAEIALAFVPGGTPLVNIIKKTTEAITGEKSQSIADTFRQEAKTYRRQKLRSLEQFEREFQTLLQQHIVNKGGRLIVFIDDLDRCLPEKSIDVLEGIKLFLDVPGCIFVLALDRDVVIKTLQTRYQDRIKPRQYLEKIIQVPFQLPPIEKSYMQQYIDTLVPNLPSHQCAEIFAAGLSPSPREVKRVINIFILLWKLAQHKLPQEIQPARLAKLVTIQHRYPKLYELLREMPHLLRDLETYCRAESENEIDATVISEVDPAIPTQLHPFVRQANLRQLLGMYPPDTPDTNFADLSLQEINAYIYLTHSTIIPDRNLQATRAKITEPSIIIIRAGSFVMGNNQEYPLANYGIGRYPITNYEYRAFVQDTNHTPPRHWNGDNYPEGISDHPVVFVRWGDAIAYCQWLSQKTDKDYRLPTEPEWEKAAHGDKQRIWPWGNDWDTNLCNSREADINTTSPVGQYSPAGDSTSSIADMAGNVWEWCSSLYRHLPYRADDGCENLQASGDRVVRGGSFSDNKDFTRTDSRSSRHPNSSNRNIGFRIVLDI